MAINPDKLYYEYINYIYKECPEIVDYPFISLLKRSGFIKETKKTKKEFKRLSRYFLNRSDAENYVYTCTDIVKDERLDSYIEKGVNVELSHQSVDGLYAEKISQKNITKEDWLPKDRIYHEEEFFDWINSINSGFQNRLYYKKYDLYCQQCYNWLTENKSLADFDELDDARDYMFQEFDRCYDNTMYFAIKYAYLKDGDVEGGRRKYTITEGYEHHKILLYLYDCGYSLMLGKPRQIGSTSILGIAAIKEVLLNSNFYLKFVTEDETTGKEIFEDKIKFTYSELPDWWKTKISNFSGTLFKLGKNKEKGEISEVNSKIEVLAPKRTAINGGSPQLVYLDEIGSIGMLSEMIREGRPTMFYVDPKTGKLTMKRRILAWGTGTSATKGRGAYEKEWNSLMSLWLQKKFEAGIVPLFFDWTTRLKTQEEYDKEKEYYYGGGYGSNEGIDIDTSKVQFHQHYPSSPSDMFQTTAKTVIPSNYIYDAYARIRQAAQIDKSEYGYFTPIYDSTGEKVVGSDWNICERDDPLCSTQIFRHPDPAYKNRYYMGTDPVAANTGHSKMSSTIYDDLFGIPSALLNHRVQGDHRESFMQCLLLGMYYSPTEEIPELVERNIGQNYIDFVEKHGKYDRLVCNSQLPEYLQSGSGAIIGIDNKGKRTEYIIANMREGFTETHHKIYILTYFEQLKTFVCKMRSNGNETWETIDKKIYFDDALFSFVFAYLCKKCYYDRYPVNIEKEGENSVKSIKYAYQHDKDYNLIIKPKLETQRKHG